MLTALFCLNTLWICLFVISFVFGKWHNTQNRYRQQMMEENLDTLLHDLYDAFLQISNLSQVQGAKWGYVYVLKSDSGHYKIGKTSDPAARLITFEVNLPIEVDYLVLIHSPNYHLLETVLHRRFKHKLIYGEWFNLSTTDLMLLKQFPGNMLQ